MGAYILPDDKKVAVSLSGVDDVGNPASFGQGTTVAWSTSDDTVVTVVSPNPDTPSDPLSAVISSTAKLGTAQVSAVITDPTAAAGSAPITALLDVQTAGSAAVSAVVVPGTPVSRL